MKVAIGMSGGVDSSVAAYILKNKGYDVLGVTGIFIENDKTKDSIKDAKSVCDKLGIKHVIIDLKKEFKEIVINNFIESYKNNLTPNPCCICNKKIKFGLFYQKCKELGYDYIATGHYVGKNGSNLICLGDKDQSYFLYGIDKDIIDHIILPLNDIIDKNKVREIAKSLGLNVADKKDSQEICFIPNDDYVSYIKEYMNNTPGNIILNGNIIGKHEGLYKYTIGQRKGLGLSYKEPLYVIGFNKDKNELIVGTNDQLFKNKLIADNINLLQEIDENTIYYAKVRSRGNKEKCKVKLDNNKLYIEFTNKVRAITPGQSVVLYKDNILLGGGIISQVLDK